MMPEMLSLRAGWLDTDPVDAVAGRRFQELLDVAAELADVVIVSAPGWGHPETEVLTQRLDYLVFVGRLGRLSAVDVGTVSAESTTYRAQVVGLVLLRRHHWLSQSITDRWIRSRQPELVRVTNSEVAVGVGTLPQRRSSAEAATDPTDARADESRRHSIDTEFSIGQQEGADAQSEALDRGVMDR